MKTLTMLAALWTALSAAPQEIGWLKLDQAKAIAAHTNKLILVYVACDPRSGSAPCSGGTGERAFADAAILKRQEEFHFVRICEKKTAQLVKATKPPEAIILDADGDEICRAGFSDAASLELVLAAALQRFSAHEVHWAGELPASPNGRTLLVVGFDDEKGEALKAFEDRILVKYHDRIVFVRFPARKDVDAAKKWGVPPGPAVVICDAAKESPEKNALERLTGKKTPAQLKAALQKALLKIEPKK
ncbi:MAG TPA: hypothetical protein VE981_21010 [Planctomycetota bacterium]|nr:hypothetical protein [Planctomycetota bacterium]